MKILTDDELKSIAVSSAIKVKNNKKWTSDLSKQIEKYSSSDVDLTDTNILSDLFNSDAVCATGQANSYPIVNALNDEEFRKLFSQKVNDIKSKDNKNLEDFRKLYNELIEELKQRCGAKPRLKLSRALCALFPENISVIGNIDTLKNLHDKIFGDKNKHPVEMHFKVSNKLNDLLGPIDRNNIQEFVERMILPWQIHSDVEEMTMNNMKKESSAKMNGKRYSNIPLNQILFGPPGTGKTYNTVNKAVETIAPEFIKRIAPGLADNEKRKLIKEEFNRYLKSGEIAFTTFHQSYSYEDFVEGIKAEVVGSNVNYSVEPGVFKTLCEKASSDIERVVNEAGVKLGNRRVWKMSLGDTQTDEGDSIFQECHSNSYVLLGYGGDIDFSGCSSQAEIVKKYEETGYTPKSQDYSVTSVNTFINKISVGDIIIVSDGNYRYRAIAEVTGEYGKLTNERDHWFQMRPVKWHLVYTPSQPREALCKLAFSQMTLYELKSNTLNRDFLQELLGPSDSKEQVPLKKSHVLIIDEINRGNISKIFGELITLIEPDKRKGAEEEISVILPYSKKLFSVPQNVHIIGTMNTADASIAKLDVALRRRFKFTEMPPKPSLLGIVKFIDPENKEVEINLNEMLKAINQRIELLYDREHTIGHSFFMKLENGSPISDLAAIFEKEIIPLLQEYFFDDWERIHWVLDAYKTNNELFFVHKKDKPEGIMGERWKNANSQPSLADVWELNLDSDLLLIQDSAAYIGIYDEDKNEPKSSQS